MTRFSLAVTLLLALAAPALAAPMNNSELAIYWSEWIEICTTGRGWKFSEAERLKVCLVLEQHLRDHGRCMYSPGVRGIWDGKNCR